MSERPNPPKPPMKMALIMSSFAAFGGFLYGYGASPRLVANFRVDLSLIPATVVSRHRQHLW